MSRLQRGEDATIDMINDHVKRVKESNIGSNEYKDSFAALLEIFRPLILGICYKWSRYFNDTTHKIKPFEELVADAEYWFMRYTTEKYIIDGDATFNSFIKQHIDQRIRYIYETELRYYSRNIFPDPTKNDHDEDIDTLERVIYNYSSSIRIDSMSDNCINRDIKESRNKVAHKILDIVENSNLYTPREKTVFKGIMYDGMTHEEMGRKLNVSRARITQILKKIKTKLYNQMNNNEELWDMIYKADIEFKEI